ncbi:MAG: hypothetical protein II837_14700, partial [Treponema sp.]|nr:hypothetical protein [Treponema sp.]
MGNKDLGRAKAVKNDEFYTQYADIQKEVNAYIEYNPDVFRGKTVLCPCDDPEWSNFTKFFAQNFDFFGLKKLISTSYAYNSKSPKPDFDWQPTLFESGNPAYDAEKSPKHGKIFTLTDQEEPPRDINKLKWHYLDGDGDFRSDEVLALLKEADIVVTNPPFSLFREFIAWIFGENKQFLVIGNMNAITYKEIFPRIKDNQLWLGATGNGSDMVFGVPEGAEVKVSDRQKAERLGYKGDFTRLGNSCWYTNLEHGRRHRELSLMDTRKNMKFSRHKEILGIGYKHYDNYNAIEVPYTDAIPSDYDGIMGVPISFLDKYCPEQFEILGITKTWFGMASKVYPEQIQVDSHGRESVVTKLNDGAVLK